MPSETVKLSPCPFCGSDRITVFNIRDGQQAVCKDCKSLGAPKFHGPDGFEATWGRAVEAWNRRAIKEPAPQKVKALEWAQHPSGKPLWRAQAPHVGWYGVSAIIEPASWQFQGLDEHFTLDVDSAEAGFAAAQADYERRILSALASPPFRRCRGWPFQFPTMLRKMWSGSEVQDWLDEHVNRRFK